jgi:hypothetical protein
MATAMSTQTPMTRFATISCNTDAVTERSSNASVKMPPNVVADLPPISVVEKPRPAMDRVSSAAVSSSLLIY